MNNDIPTHYRAAATSRSIPEAFWVKAHAEPDTLLYRYAVASSAQATRVWRSETYRSAAVAIARIAHFLASRGVRQGTTVAIMSNTRPEWMLADIAIQTLGGITVSVYQSLTATEAGFILFDSEAKVLFVENEEQAQKAQWLRDNHCAIPARETIPDSEQRVPLETIISFERVSGIKDITPIADIIEDTTLSSEPPPVPATLNRDSVSTYVYTSGTTGPPKGVIQTHGNHLTNVEQAARTGVFFEDASIFLYLPLAHSFARLVYHVGFLTSASLTLPAVTDHTTSKLDLSSIARDIRESGCMILPSVPRLFEKMASALRARAQGSNLQSRILGLSLKNARRKQVALATNSRFGILDEMMYQAFAGIRAKITAQLFGSNFRHAISGGAKLDREVNLFFDSLGIRVCEGYGLTETCVATHVNHPQRHKIGSVGVAFPGVEVMIAPEDGEISLRGPNVARGYLNRPQATQEAWSSDGWFHTGDIGRVDEEGFLFITDRKKELVITAGGKKIPPVSIEGLFKKHPFISQAFLFGEGKPYCVMLFTLNEAELRAVLQSKGVTISPSQKLSSTPEVLAIFDAAVSEANTSLASYESIKQFAILDEDFTIENGLLTPTMKMKRKPITERYRALLESLYN